MRESAKERIIRELGEAREQLEEFRDTLDIMEREGFHDLELDEMDEMIGAEGLFIDMAMELMRAVKNITRIRKYREGMIDGNDC